MSANYGDTRRVSQKVFQFILNVQRHGGKVEKLAEMIKCDNSKVNLSLKISKGIVKKLPARFPRFPESVYLLLDRIDTGGVVDYKIGSTSLFLQ